MVAEVKKHSANRHLNAFWLGQNILKAVFPDLKADFILANPPFHMRDWGGEHLRDDKRSKFGVLPIRKANFAWVHPILHHLAPADYTGFVLANGSLPATSPVEGSEPFEEKRLDKSRSLETNRPKPKSLDDIMREKPRELGYDA